MRRFTLPASWVLGVATLVLWGRQPNPYLEHVRLIPPPHPYPVEGVVRTAVFMAVCAGLVQLVLRPASYRHSWRRALSALLISCAFLVHGGLAAMHMPPYFGVYLAWLAALTAALGTLSTWSAMGAIRTRHGGSS